MEGMGRETGHADIFMGIGIGIALCLFQGDLKGSGRPGKSQCFLHYMPF